MYEDLRGLYRQEDNSVSVLVTRDCLIIFYEEKTDLERFWLEINFFFEKLAKAHLRNQTFICFFRYYRQLCNLSVTGDTNENSAIQKILIKIVEQLEIILKNNNKSKNK